MLLKLKNINIAFKTENGTKPVAESLNFSMDRGEVVGIVGESGSGKSITALSIIGLLPKKAGVSSGEILFYENNNPVDLLKLSEIEKQHYRGKRISMIFQEPMTSLNPVMKCGEQIVEAIVQHQNLSSKKAKQIALKLLEDVQIPRPKEIMKSYPHQLSGGQRQRIMIAIALSCNPEIIIADEPTTALDVSVQKNIIELLKSLQKKYKLGILFISHDLSVVSNIAQKLLVMYKGKIVEQGDCSEILKNPQHEYTKALLACRPPLNERPKRLFSISNFIDSSEKKTIDFITENERKTVHKNIYQNEPILEIKNLKTYFEIRGNIFGKNKSQVRAVDNVSFDLFKGETLGLVGESGCGKTTLGRTILKLIEASDGEIIYKGQNLRTISTKEMRKLRRKIQIIFQDPYSSLNPRKTIGEIISEPMKVHRIGKNKKERIELTYELLESVKLDEAHFYKYPHEFSGGQRQRIGIARALALKPELIICDESVSALDVSVQATVLNMLNELKKKFNLTYIFISHDLSVVKYMSDRIIVLNKGELEEIGEADSVYKSPIKAYTKKLIESIPKL
ncbi:MAG: ABC transporter ATP-binding protein [Bacteroidetes bacterium]|jgi:peptide/nickel transport system ATP-binding protein|nr:ABC transporter ATP-binding protein [Bacteroidota bacterium]MBT6686335.1 ABC transporter ATP-binding protein [Bacteroidota bacterium]MBT7142168.1 ABC transporter ATP-binding protein [Bacteroidota bacterium]MBT7490477.1 ABC transporter ATP-binding protein [Bacteroidota bacterium]